MIERPDVSDEAIITGLEQGYNLRITGVEFLPLGADDQASVFRVWQADGTDHFLKMRVLPMDEDPLQLVDYLAKAGLDHILTPIPTLQGRQWHDTGMGYGLILYPFIHAGVGARPDQSGWKTIGRTLRRLHSLPHPPGLVERLGVEDFSSPCCQILLDAMQEAPSLTHLHPEAARLAEFFVLRGEEIREVVRIVRKLAAGLKPRYSLENMVICHGDCHTMNLMVDEHGTPTIIDWDDAMIAPKERDLMFITGTAGATIGASDEEQSWFYEGYGAVEIDWPALLFYQYDWAVQDMGLYAEQLLHDTQIGAETRSQIFIWLTSKFTAGDVIETARRLEHQHPVR